MILLTRLRYVPSLLYVLLYEVVFLGAIYGSCVITVPDTSVLPATNTANEWGSVSLLMLIAYHRVQTT